MNKKNYVITILIIALFIYLSIGLKMEQPAEELEIVNGFGGDIKKENNDIKFVTSFSIYAFNEGEKISSDLRISEGETPRQCFQNKQLSSSKQYVLGFEKAYIFSEELAEYGLESVLELFFKDPNTNDFGYTAICEGKATDMLKYKVNGYPSSSDFIEGLLKNAYYYNFLSSHNKIYDFLLTYDSEGKSIVLPYINIENKKIQIGGVCLFKEDKMIGKLDTDETKYLNILRGSDGKGIITLKQGEDKYLDYYSYLKRKVSVEKKGENYKFIISLNFTGDIVENTLDIKLPLTNATNIKIQDELEKHIKYSCNEFIKKLKNDYKVDALELGQYAVAKYGRDTGVDWDEVVSNSEIEVNVNVQIDRKGRGDFISPKND